MIRSENTPTRQRTVMEEAYVAAGDPSFQFTVPQPFTAEHVAGVTAVGASPVGVANQLNQVLAENLGNNIAAKIRAAVKAGQSLPTQSDMDTLYSNYDFSGTRTRTADSLLDRIFAKLCGSFIRKLIKKKGYQGAPAPVTVAKEGEEPKAGQISYEVFEDEVIRLINGDGPWGEVAAFIEVRDGLMEDAREEEAAVRNREVVAEGKLSGLGL